MVEALAKLRERFEGRRGRVGVVTHEGCLQALLAVARRPPRMPEPEIGNAARLRLRAKAEGWTLVA